MLEAVFVAPVIHYNPFLSYVSQRGLTSATKVGWAKSSQAHRIVRQPVGGPTKMSTRRANADALRP